MSSILTGSTTVVQFKTKSFKYLVGENTATSFLCDFYPLQIMGSLYFALVHSITEYGIVYGEGGVHNFFKFHYNIKIFWEN